MPPEEKLEAAAEWLRARQSLLVLDDVWSADVKQLEPGGPCSVLYTSRQQSLPWISAGHTGEVVSFTDAECESLFHATLDKDFGERMRSSSNARRCWASPASGAAAHRRGRGREPAAGKDGQWLASRHAQATP